MIHGSKFQNDSIQGTHSLPIEYPFMHVLPNVKKNSGIFIGNGSPEKAG